MEMKKSIGPQDHVTSTTSTTGDSGESTSVPAQVIASTLQSFVWSEGEQSMNLSHPYTNILSLETSSTQSMNDESIAEVYTSYDSTSSDVNLTLDVPTAAAYAYEFTVRVMVCSILLTVVIFIGLITNALSLMVMVRRNLRNQHMVVFLIPLALFDITKLITDIHLGGLIHIIPNSFDITTYSALSCEISSWVAVASMCISSWIIVVMTVERAMTVSDPIKFKSQWSIKLSVSMVLIPILVISLLTVFTMWAVEVDTDPVIGLPICALKKQNTHFLIMGIVGALVYSIVPCLIIFILNGIIIKGLFAQKQLTMSAGESSRQRQEMRITITVLCISIFFLLTASPYGFYSIYYLTPDAERVNHIWLEITLLSSLNHSLNFVFYGICGKKFRKEFVDMVCCISSLVKKEKSQLDKTQGESTRLDSRRVNSIK